MKRIISLLLCIAMLMLFPAQALASEGDLVVVNTEDGPLNRGIESSCGVNDSLYFILYGNRSRNERILGIHRLGETELKQYAIQIGNPIENDGYDSIRLLSNGEKVYALRQIRVSTEDVISYTGNTQSTTAELYEITFDGESAEATLICEPDWSIFSSEDGYIYIQSMCCVGDRLVICYYNNYDTTKLAVMNLADGSFEECNFEDETISLAPYQNGTVLIQQYTDDTHEKVRFISFDPATKDDNTLCEIDIPQWDPFNGLACDCESGAVYYTKHGEIFELNLQTGESSEAITDMPETTYSDASVMVLQSKYYAVASYDCYIIRNLHPSQKPTQHLKIYDGSYNECVSQTVYAFSNEHSDTSVILSRDYTSESSLTEDMMNRSDDIDIYIMDAASAAYESVFERAYIADLSGSEKILATADRMYPAMRKALSINGELCAIPVNFYFWMPYLQEETLNMLNMTIEDVPTNWSDFLDFLMVLPDKLPADGSVSLMDPGMGDISAKRALFESIFACYQQLLQKDPNAFSTDQMLELLQKLERVNFQALGQPAETDESDYNYDYNQRYLLETNMGTSLAGICNQHPVVMSLTPNTPKMLVASATVAFINPFSQNRALALEFIEKLVDNLPYEVNYTMYSDLTDPVVNKYYQENIDSMQESIDALRKQYENAEAIDKQDIQEQLLRAESDLENYENYRYSLSEKDVAWIHQYADALMLQANNWLYRDGSGEASQLVRQYSEGTIDARKLMDEIGHKLRMMMMEGY